MKTRFSIQYHTNWGENLCVELQGRKFPLSWESGDIWTATVETTAAALKDYTYLVMRDSLIIRTEWEHHSIKPEKGAKSMDIEDSWKDCPIPGCEFPRKHQAPKFDIPGFRGAGTAVPVFALRTEDDFGIGDFRDLRPLVDWAAATGQCIIQLLPVNDTTRKGDWRDSYPYNPVSSFALHPLYIRLQDIGVKETPAFRKKRKELNGLREIDYPAVFEAKMSLARKAFREHGEADMKTAEYRRFRKENAHWLDEYALFCARRDSDTPEFHAWLQYHLDRQLFEEAGYARSKGISFKGDLPIGVGADSADAYYSPEIVNEGTCAGAPPDFFSRDGQNWGFPTYNWEAMARDGYSWWKRRLKLMSRWFDAFRIDHILGFFRIWEIPAGCHGGLEGHFNPAVPYSAGEIEAAGLPLEGLFHKVGDGYQPHINPDTSKLTDDQRRRFSELHTDFFFHRNDSLWERGARAKLPELLRSTGMLACGEDLGMAPACVQGVMDSERILSLEMPGMDKGRPWPRRSVCAISSHDSATLRMQRPEDPSPGECRAILAGTLQSAPMLAIFPIQDWLSMSAELRRADRDAERINEPADPAHHWRYRLHIDLGVLATADHLNAALEEMLRASGRHSETYRNR